MRILVNDFSGHPFQAQLSRYLAGVGHDVIHAHFSEFQTPKGCLERRSDDPKGLEFRAVSIGRQFAKHKLLARRTQEIEYAALVVDLINTFRPDVVLACNNPLDAQRLIHAGCRSRNVRFVFWLQDIYSVAINQIMTRRFGLLGTLLGAFYRNIERQILRKSDHIISIADDFGNQLKMWNVAESRISVIPNWAPLDEMQVSQKDNPWARRFGLQNKKVVLYTGTLGFKHNPEILVQLAEQHSQPEDVEVVVVSEGPGADYVKSEALRRGLGNLKVLPFQPMGVYPDVLGTGDVLVSMLEPGAGQYSVPSKVLSYLCSRRPIVLSVPWANAAARVVVESGAGYVSDPSDLPNFLSSVARMLSDPEAAVTCATAGRRYAERQFDINEIGRKFEDILKRCVAAESYAGVRAGFPQPRSA
jgi:colanic acid biosynthesis glycosyl transferase WcaI